MTDHKYAHHIYPILLCVLLMWLGCWGVLSVRKALADDFKGHVLPKDEINCFTCCRYENGKIVQLSKAECNAVDNDMHWVQAIQEANKRLVEQLKTSREREEITGRLVAELVGAMKKLDFQIDVLTKATLGAK